MVQFGYLYLNGKLTIYDVTMEVRAGRVMYVASLSEDPGVNYAAIRLDAAVQQLTEFLVYRARQQSVLPIDRWRSPQRRRAM